MKEEKIAWFSVFRRVVPADYEQWLEQLALAGWHPRKIGQFSSLRLVFEQGEPRRYRYVFDLNAFPKADYRQTYAAFGWEFVGQMASCFIWRQAYTGERPESFSDAESLLQRNRRVKHAVLASLLLFAVTLLALLVGLVLLLPQLRLEQLLQFLLGIVLCGLFLYYLSGVIRAINRHRPPA